MNEILTFDKLAEQIKFIHASIKAQAKNAINSAMTMRNWLIGYYIVEFEQHGEQRAEYGSFLLKRLEKRLNEEGLNTTLLKLCRKFYLVYPNIGTVIKRRLVKNQLLEKSSMLSHLLPENNITEDERFVTPPETLISKLSFSHIREIMTINDSFERFFYEFECMRCNWSVLELRRQIATRLFVRAGLSKNPEKLLKLTKNNSTEQLFNINDPFVFEFLGIDSKQIVSESDVEQAILDHLQEFLLEMGKGFCFEARQKRITIDDRYYFADLVLYNRILHCSVIIELKLDEFKHEHLGQLNTYVAYYKANEMNEGDNPHRCELRL